MLTYLRLKEELRKPVSLITSHTDRSAREAGFKDVFDLILSKFNSKQFAMFIVYLLKTVPIKHHRTILLNGLVVEYCSCGNWIEYVEKENANLF